MKWKRPKAKAHIRLKQRWHKWFAWHPVIVMTYGRSYVIWLEDVERRGMSWMAGGMGWEWKYREINCNNKLTTNKR